MKMWYIFRVPGGVRERAGGGQGCGVKPEDEPPSPLTQLLKALQVGAAGTQVGPAATAGYLLIGSLALMGGLGYAFDRWRGTQPTGLVVGLLLGVVVGLYLLAKELWRR